MPLKLIAAFQNNKNLFKFPADFFYNPEQINLIKSMLKLDMN